MEQKEACPPAPTYIIQSSNKQHLSCLAWYACACSEQRLWYVPGRRKENEEHGKVERNLTLGGLMWSRGKSENDGNITPFVQLPGFYLFLGRSLFMC